jgi:hypothetical protein
MPMIHPSLLPALVALLLIAGCTYNGARMGQRQDCGAMPQSQAQRCFSRTEMTKQEYDAERRKLERSKEFEAAPADKEVDPRYEKWIP